MHRSKLPLTTWFWTAHLMATHSDGMSARQLEDQLGVTYKTAWRMGQQIRLLMAKADGFEMLKGHVELDETFVGGDDNNRHFDKKKGHKGGKKGHKDGRKKKRNQPPSTPPPK